MKTIVVGLRLCEWPLRLSVFLVAVGIEFGSVSSLRAQDQTVTGNLSVTGTVDVDGNTLTFGTQSTSPGLSLTYTDADTDTLTFFLNRNPASFLWAHSASIAAMRLNSSHQLVLYKSDGTTAGLTFTPATSTISLGATTLYRDSSSGALRTNGALTVDGSFSATTFAATNGSITGGSSGLTLNAGGSGSQNITLSPNGSGNVIVNGKLGVGVSSPTDRLTVAGPSWASTGSASNINTFAGTGITLNGSIAGSSQNAISYQSGGSGGAAAIAFGRGSSWDTFMSFYTNSSSNQGGLAERMRIISTGNVGIGTATPQTNLHINASGAPALRVESTSDTYSQLELKSGGKLWQFSKRNSSQANRLGLYYHDGSNWSGELFTVGTNGNIGMGAENPQTNLHINTFGAPILRVESMSDVNSQLELKSGGKLWQFAKRDSGQGNRLSLFFHDGSNWSSELLSVAPNGNIGIGTANSTAKLEVAGDIRATNLTEKFITFTPTTVGWYRIVSWSNSTGGVLRIYNDGYDNTITDVELNYNIAGWGQGGGIVQTRFSSYNSGVVHRARISSNAASVFLDVYVGRAGTPQPLKVYAYGPDIGSLVANPVVGATAGPTDVQEIGLDHGVRTTRMVSAPKIELTDIHAPDGYGAVTTTLNDTGGWEYISQQAGRDISVWNWKTGGGPERTILQLKASKDDTNNSSYLALNNGSEVAKVMLNTGGTSYFAGGNVGIGTTSPSAKLSVNGDVKVAGSILIPPQGDLSMGSFTQGPSPTGL